MDNFEGLILNKIKILRCQIWLNLTFLVSQIHVHRKFMLKSSFYYFKASPFTSILNYEIRSHKIPTNLGISNEIPHESVSFSLKITKNRYNCHSHSSRFIQTLKREITFTLDSRNLWSQPITYVFVYMYTASKVNSLNFLLFNYCV